MIKRRKHSSSCSLPMNSIRQLDLLPEEFRDEVETLRARGFWILAFSLLSIGLGHLVLTDLFRHESNRRFETRLRAKVEPVLKIRDDARRQLTDLSSRRRWIEQLDTARPDDSLVQALAAVATAVGPDADRVMIDSIEISLATELPASPSSPQSTTEAEQPTLVTTPTIIIGARSDANASASLVSRLSEQPRIDHVTIEPNLNGDGSRIQLMGVPRSTRILP